jgi:hypothetical protein
MEFHSRPLRDQSGKGSGSTIKTAYIATIAIQEQLNGKAVDWMEHVTDEPHLAASVTTKKD